MAPDCLGSESSSSSQHPRSRPRGLTACMLPGTTKCQCDSSEQLQWGHRYSQPILRAAIRVASVIRGRCGISFGPRLQRQRPACVAWHFIAWHIAESIMLHTIKDAQETLYEATASRSVPRVACAHA